MVETKSNGIKVPTKDRYLLTIREAGAYFGLWTKYMHRIVEANEGGFAIFIGNKYMITRRKYEEYMADKNTIECVGLCVVNVPHIWYNFRNMGGTVYE